jgi:hypothetical protein
MPAIEGPATERDQPTRALPAATGARRWPTWWSGSRAVQVISENPYWLARDIRGIGFKTADQIAQGSASSPPP